MSDLTKRPAASSPGSFLVLNENRFAYTAMRRLERTRADGCYPVLYVHGPSGSGKSLLVRQFLRDAGKHSSRKIAHVTAAEFAAQLAEASADRQIDAFQKRFRDLDLLICEDLSALANRYESQRQLIAVIDAVVQSGGRCFLTSRSSPGQMTNTLPRLVNRCHGGVCVGMQLPAHESRVALILHFSMMLKMHMPSSVVEMLARELPVSPRELLATVFQLEAISKMQKVSVDNQLAGCYLKDESKPHSPSKSQIARAVGRHFGISVFDLRSAQRRQGSVLPRRCAMLLARELTGESLHSIARYFGRQNHSSVIHACTRLRDMIAADPTLGQHLTRIRTLLGTRSVSECL